MVFYTIYLLQLKTVFYYFQGKLLYTPARIARKCLHAKKHPNKTTGETCDISKSNSCNMSCKMGLRPLHFRP